MVNFVEPVCVEYFNSKNVELCCAKCSKAFADFRYCESISRRFWRIDRNNVNWNIRYKVRGAVLFCECDECLGNASAPNIYILKRSAFKLNY